MGLFKTEHNYVPYTQFCVFRDAAPWNLPNITPLILEIIHQKLCSCIRGFYLRTSVEIWKTTGLAST